MYLLINWELIDRYIYSHLHKLYNFDFEILFEMTDLWINSTILDLWDNLKIIVIT